MKVREGFPFSVYLMSSAGSKINSSQENSDTFRWRDANKCARQNSSCFCAVHAKCPLFRHILLFTLNCFSYILIILYIVFSLPFQTAISSFLLEFNFYFSLREKCMYISFLYYECEYNCCKEESFIARRKFSPS